MRAYEDMVYLVDYIINLLIQWVDDVMTRFHNGDITPKEFKIEMIAIFSDLQKCTVQ